MPKPTRRGSRSPRRSSSQSWGSSWSAGARPWSRTTLGPAHSHSAGHEPRLCEGGLFTAQPENPDQTFRFPQGVRPGKVCHALVYCGSALSQGCPTRPSQWHQRLCCQQHGLCAGTFKPNPRISWSVSGVLQQRPRRVVASWSTLGPRKQLDGYSRLSQTKPARGLLSPTRFSNTCAPSADRLRHSERLVRVRCSHVSQRWVPSTPLQAHVARCSGKVVPQPELR